MFDDKPLTVGQLTATIREVLEIGFQQVWVEGEITNLYRAASGHIYLKLKDSEALLKAVLWRGNAVRLQFQPQEGLAVVCRGKISVYPPNGEYQLVVDSMLPKGVGAAELKLRQLKEKLQAKGYFRPDRKRPLPRFPKRIGLVTSPSGAAVRDMLEVFTKRWPHVEIILFPVRVQGESAGREIAEAIQAASVLHNFEYRFDVLIVGRGGGSAEDLASFNEEVVADAIFQATMPIVSAVGHEIDLCIADLVADYRALTPTQAAVACTPDRQELLQGMDAARSRFSQLMAQRLENLRLRLQVVARHRFFQQPAEMVRDAERRLDDIFQRMQRSQTDRIKRADNRLGIVAAKLDSLSPLKVLGRGYTLTWDAETRKLLREPSDTAVGKRIVTRLPGGEITGRVEEIRPLPLETHGD